MSKDIEDHPHTIGLETQWQTPAITEKNAYELMKINANQAQEFLYLGFPWASMIDGVQRQKPYLGELLIALNVIAKLSNKRQTRIATVSQHISTIEFMQIFESVGITDLFIPHKLLGQDVVNGIRLHPFPLYPTQVASKPIELNISSILDVNRDSKFLANFIGSYIPEHYISNTRERILQDAGKTKEVLIIRRDSWHFEREVYKEQMGGYAPKQQELDESERRKNEYLDAILDSTFTLCPTGSGPNSIRLFECLLLNSIPVILTKNLELPGHRALWEKACIFEEDSPSGYEHALRLIRNIKKGHIIEMREAGKELSKQIDPSSVSKLILNQMRYSSKS